MNRISPAAPVGPLALFLLSAACASSSPTERLAPEVAARLVHYPARSEVVADFASLVPPQSQRRERAPVRIERVSAGVPWPRGLALVDGELVVLARGRHRRAGGVDHEIADFTGSLFRVDLAVAEPVVPGVVASAAIAANAEPFAIASGAPFRLPDRSLEPIRDVLMDRPYCTLLYDDVSRNLFVCGYSGVDLPGARFRKNATDSILRYDLRTREWHPVELHDPSVVPEGELGFVVSNEYYPHHDPTENPPPHGWLNGPDGGCVAGSKLYCVSKDNHLVVQYDLAELRGDPGAGFPASRPVLGPRVSVRSPSGVAEMELLGPSAAAVHGDYLYLGYRTSSVVVRFPLTEAGELAQPPVGELVAVFEPWDPEERRSANVIDIAFDSRGELFVSCSREGRIWRVGRPDPERPFYGDDRSERPTSAPPYADLRELTGVKTTCGNILFDDEDRLYVCAGNYDTSSDVIAGAIYRISPVGS